MTINDFNSVDVTKIDIYSNLRKSATADRKIFVYFLFLSLYKIIAINRMLKIMCLIL